MLHNKNNASEFTAHYNFTSGFVTIIQFSQQPCEWFVCGYN